MHTKRLIPLLLTVTLSACTVGPNYQTPKTPVDPSFDMIPGATTQKGQPARADWWTLLNDPALDALVTQAAAENLDVKQAQLRIRQAREQRSFVFGSLLPQVDGNAGYSRQRFSQNAAPFNAFQVPNFPWEFDLYQVGFDASWELDIFGGNRRALEAAGRDVEAALEDHHAVIVALQGEIARTYVELRGAQRERTLAQANLASQNETVALTRNRVQNGVGNDLDVSRAVAQASGTEAAIPLFDRATDQAIHRLATLTNRPIAELAYLLDEKAIPRPPDTIDADIPANLIRRRPDIRRAERQLAAATARIGVAEAELYPKLSLTGAFSMQSASVEDLFDWRSRAFNLGPTIRWPIFQAGQLRNVVNIRTTEQEEALITYERTIQGAIEEVRDQLTNYATESRRHTSLANAVRADEDAVNLADQLYRQGLTDFLTVLDAQRTLFLQQDELARSEARLTESFIALYKALGGGWQIEEVNQNVASAGTPAAPPPPTPESKP